MQHILLPSKESAKHLARKKQYNTPMLDESTRMQLQSVAKQMVTQGKGILAADESIKTVEKRLSPIHVENTPDNRSAFREMLLTTPGESQYISGVILFDETIRQATSS